MLCGALNGILEQIKGHWIEVWKYEPSMDCNSNVSLSIHPIVTDVQMYKYASMRLIAWETLYRICESCAISTFYKS